MNKTGGVLALIVVAACGGGKPEAAEPRASTSGDPEADFGPLEVGADYEKYKKLAITPWRSETHGNRWVVVYANDKAYEPYIKETEFPEGAVLVKASWEDAGGRPSETTPGPIFVMQKRAPGYDPEHGDWWYAIHWANPTPDAAEKFGGPFYWRGKSEKASYCWRCHDNYDRSVGGIPEAHQSWKK